MFSVWTDWLFVLWSYFLCYEFYDKFDLFGPSIRDNSMQLKVLLWLMLVKRWYHIHISRRHWFWWKRNMIHWQCCFVCVMNSLTLHTVYLCRGQTNKRWIGKAGEYSCYALLLILLPWGLLCCVSYDTSSGQLFTVFLTTHNNGKLFKDQSFFVANHYIVKRYVLLFATVCHLL